MVTLNLLRNRGVMTHDKVEMGAHKLLKSRKMEGFACLTSRNMYNWSLQVSFRILPRQFDTQLATFRLDWGWLDCFIFGILDCYKRLKYMMDKLPWFQTTIKSRRCFCLVGLTQPGCKKWKVSFYHCVIFTVCADKLIFVAREGPWLSICNDK